MQRTMMVLGIVLAAAATASAGSVAFVDAERAVREVGEGRAKLAELEAWAGPRRAELEQLQQEATELSRELQQKRPVATAEVVGDLEMRARDAVRRFEDARRAYERELARKQDEFLADVAVKVGTVASEYGREQGLDAIFVLNAQPLVYVSDAADLTDTVIRMYDQRFPAAAE